MTDKQPAPTARRTQPSPSRFAGDEPFWDGTAAGIFRVSRCLACRETFFYPRSHCPLCGSREVGWLDTSGRGRVHTFSVARSIKRPTAVAMVELPEGPVITTSIVDADLFDLEIGDEVEVMFEQAETGEAVPMFTTVAANRARAYAARTQAESAHVPGVDPEQAREVRLVGIVGAGTMGTGIATAILTAGVPVVLVDASPEALGRARGAVRSVLEHHRARGRIDAPDVERLFALLRTQTEVEALAEADLVIEAVWEQMSLKQQILGRLDAVVRPDALVATNTSSLNLDEIAGATAYPERVVGLHFFSPANIMRLVEVVRGEATSTEALAIGVRFVQRIEKTPVVVGVWPGFVGNAMMIARGVQATSMLLEGALPDQIDRVAREIGWPMGPFEMWDLGGAVDLRYHKRQETGEEDWLNDQLYERGRLGQKTAKGYYDYVEATGGARAGRLVSVPSREVAALVAEASKRLGIERRPLGEQEIHDRLLYSMVNVGFTLLERGVAARAGDIDVVWREGFGMPTWKGGPMYDAEHSAHGGGLPRVLDALRALAARHGEAFTPAPLLERLVATGGCLTDPDRVTDPAGAADRDTTADTGADSTREVSA